MFEQMTEYIISLDVETSLSVTAMEVSELLGVNKSEIDSRRLRKRKRILWRYEPVFRENVKLLTRIKKLASQLNIKEPIRKGRRIKAIYFSIGVFHEIDCFDCGSVG